MPVPSLFQLTDHVLVQEFVVLVRKSDALTAQLLVYLAEIDRRRLYAPAGFESMHRYCVEYFGFSDDSASKRIHAARAARDFPALYDAVAEGRLHLSAVVLLAPHLNPANAERLIAAAGGRTCAEVRELIAAEAPRPDVAPKVVFANNESHATQHVNSYSAPASAPAAATPPTAAAATDSSSKPVPASACLPRPTIAPLSPGRSELRMTMDAEMAADLKAIMDLEGFADPSPNVATTIGRALKTYRALLEKRKFAATSRPGAARGSANARTIPSEVKRQVRQRDGGQCAFVSERGRRCECRRGLEFDHIRPIARGGRSTVENVRLLSDAQSTRGGTRVRRRFHAREAGPVEGECRAAAECGDMSGPLGCRARPIATPDPVRGPFCETARRDGGAPRRRGSVRRRRP